MRAAIGDIVAAGGADLASALLDECAAIAAHQGFPPHDRTSSGRAATLTAKGSPLMASMLRDIEGGHGRRRPHPRRPLPARRAAGRPFAAPPRRPACESLRGATEAGRGGQRLGTLYVNKLHKICSPATPRPKSPQTEPKSDQARPRKTKEKDLDFLDLFVRFRGFSMGYGQPKAKKLSTPSRAPPPPRHCPHRGLAAVWRSLGASPSMSTSLCFPKVTAIYQAYHGFRKAARTKREHWAPPGTGLVPLLREAGGIAQRKADSALMEIVAPIAKKPELRKSSLGSSVIRGMRDC